MTVIDLFAGPGGWDLAARQTGIDPLGIELEASAVATRTAAGLPTVQADVAALNPGDYGFLTGLIASPPCQPFSMAGKGAGRKALGAYLTAIERLDRWGTYDRATLDHDCDDQRAHLILEPLRWALELTPTWIALEQVPPVLPVWEATAAVLRRHRWHTWTGILSAEQYGVAQTRKRAILLAHRDRPVSAPPPTHARYVPARRGGGLTEAMFELEPVRITLPEDRHLLPWVSMADALGWGMTARPGMTFAPGTAAGGASADGGGSGARRALNAEQAAGRWNYRRVQGAGRAERHGERAGCPVDAPAFVIDSKSRSAEWITDRPATTVNCDPRISEPGHHDAEVSGSQQANAVRVTIDEAAALQSFPTGYPWQGTRTKVFEQIGNAIPPLLALAILRELTAPISSEPAQIPGQIDMLDLLSSEPTRKGPP